MSSVKLNQSLDDIVTTQRGANRGRGGNRARRGRAAPVGGVKKTTVARVSGKPTNRTGGKSDAGIPATGGSSKVIVSNLVRSALIPAVINSNTNQPFDVTEAQIKVC